MKCKDCPAYYETDSIKKCYIGSMDRGMEIPDSESCHRAKEIIMRKIKIKLDHQRQMDEEIKRILREAAISDQDSM